jgi:hypothetical protein
MNAVRLPRLSLPFSSKYCLLATVVALIGGYYLGYSSRGIMCIHNINTFIQNEVLSNPTVWLVDQLKSVSCKQGAVTTYGKYQCNIPSLDNSKTIVHNNIFEDIEKSVLTTVFGMLHHPSCPDTAEVVLTQSEDWKSDFSTCQTVYAVRSPVREDHPNKCYAVVRLPTATETSRSYYHSTTGICHRTGSIEWPQKLSDQYQVWSL